MKLIRHQKGKRSKAKEEYRGIDLRVTFSSGQDMDDGDDLVLGGGKENANP